MEWKHIKKKSIKNVMLENYIINIKNKYNLSFDSAKCILDKINHAICMKYIQSHNVKTNNDGDIIKIEGVTFDEHGNCFINYNKNGNYISKNKDNVCVINSFNGLWNIYKHTK